MFLQARAFVLLVCVIQVRSFLFDSNVTPSSSFGEWTDFFSGHESTCSHYSEYNTLHNLMTHDECMNIDSVFHLLAELTRKEGRGTCRIKIIKRLEGYFGPHARTPSYCHCVGINTLQHYHVGSGDGVSDVRRRCLDGDSDYEHLYHQFFESSSSHTPACRTHHSLWGTLKHVDTVNLDVTNSCQKDIIFHLDYAFKHHADKCSCSRNTVSHHGGVTDRCLQYNSYQVLKRLGDTDGCLSANSVWHYLDDLQVKDQTCRETIQRDLAEKYKHGYLNDDCVCHARAHLVNNQIQRMSNGSLHGCMSVTGSSYKGIESLLFSNIAANGCQNHKQLWPKLEMIMDSCDASYSSHYSHNTDTHYTHCADCTQDMIVRAAVEYPTVASDSCVCLKVSSTPLTSTTGTPKATTASTTTTAATSSVAPTIPVFKYSCNKLAVIQDIAMSRHETHPNSSPCGLNDNEFDDAYVLSACNVTSPNTWLPGARVDCKSNPSSIPPLVPISTFSHGRYVPGIARAGIFLECHNSAIKIAVQKCGGVPEIIIIETGVTANDQNTFYVVV